MNRQRRLEIAAQTERILAAGRYTGPDGEVDLAGCLAAAVAATHLLPPGVSSVSSGVSSTRLRESGRPAVEVTAESTFEAVRRLAGEADDPVLSLNFASATNPGGGFSTGATGQEEALARATGLMACLRAVPEFYELHRARRDPLYTDTMIYSPGVPAFRDDAGALLARPFPMTILTSPAPNATELAGDDARRARIPATLDRRTARILAVAAAFGHERLVLGAWGCGAFGNDPDVVAAAFAAQLATVDAFRQVVFAILPADGSPNLAAFRRRFG